MKNRGWILTSIAGLVVGGVTAPKVLSTWNAHPKSSELCVIKPEKKITKAEADYWIKKDPKTGKPAQPPFYACFSEDTDPEKMAAFHAALNQAIWSSPEYISGSAKWGVNPAGTPETVTWSLVPDGVTISSAGSFDNAGVAGPNILFATLDSQFSAIGGRAKWIAAFQAIFDRWESLSGIKFVRVRSGANEWDDGAAWLTDGNDTTRGDIRISMRNIDGGTGANVLAYNYFPETGDMVVDSANTWNAGTTLRTFRNVLAHELGHGLGFEHICPGNSTKLLEPNLATAFDGPQQDEIRNLHEKYGDKFEPSNVPATELADAALATISANGTTVLGDVPVDPNSAANTIPVNSSILSLHENGPDVDYLKFTLTAPRSIQLTASPIGSTYKEAAQASNGSCPAGVDVNSLAIADLRIGLLNSSQTVLQSVSALPAGSADSTTRVTLPAGNYLAKVDAVTGVTETQLYKLTISATAARELKGKLSVNSVTAFYPGEQVTAILTPIVGGADVTYTTTLATNGDYGFVLTNLPTGTYNLRIKGPSALIQGTGSFSVIDGIVTINRNGRNGDVDGDGEVGPADFDIVVANFGTTSTSPSSGDLDRDGEVGPSDFDLVVSSFGLSGD